MRHIAKSHIGLERGNNEDAFACAPEFGLFVIADGMGGLARGEVASRMAADQLLAGAIARTDPVFGAANAAPPDILLQAIQAVQRQIAGDNASSKKSEAMGTTATAVMIEGDVVHYVHAGDSRLYAVTRSGVISQLTRDQTVAQRMIDRGEDPVRATAFHGHVLTNYVGTEGAFTTLTGTHRLDRGDSLLLCTDGLSDLVGDDEIAIIITRLAPDLESTADVLIERANQHGGRDNITVILIQPAL